MSNPLSPPPSAGQQIEAESLTSRLGLKWWLVGGFAVIFVLGIFGARGVALVGLVAIIVVTAFFWKPILAAWRWNPATLEVATSPFLLGSSPHLIYRRIPRRTIEVVECSVHCTIVCEERATYRQGSSTRTDKAQVFEQTFTGSGSTTGAGQGLEAQITVNIPAHVGAPTFDLGDNEVHWYLDAVIVGPGLPDDKQRFPIVVGPMLDAEQRNVVGDR